MSPELLRRLLTALERPHRLGMIGGDLEEQLAHCAGFSSLIGGVFGECGPHRGADLGTGGGIPGIVLAALWPDCAWTLIDVRAGRIAEVERVALTLGLAAVTTRAIAVEELAHDPDERETYDVVVARSFGPPSVVAECAAGLTAVGSVAIVSEPPTISADRWNPAGLVALGFDPEPEMIDDLDYRFAVLHKRESTPTNVPRRPPRASRGWLP